MNRLSLIGNQLRNQTETYSLINIITSERNSKVKIIKINSLSNLNALTDDLAKELLLAFDFLMNDDSTKVVILTGSGKSFIAGADIKTLYKK